MRILLTRPRPDSEALAKLLRARGHEVLIEPLIEIVPTGPAVSLDGVQAVIATSANGIRALAAATAERTLPVFAVGDATARAAREAGFAEVDSASGDSASLVRLVTARAAPDRGALLHARGRDIANDPAEALAQAGFAVRPAVLYEAQAASALWPVLRERIVAGEIDAVLLFSPRTARTFVDLARDAGIAEACADMEAVCLSQAVADAASPLPWRAVRVAASPDQAALIKELDHAAGKSGDRPAVTEGSEPKKTVPSTLEKAVARDSAKDPGERKGASGDAGGAWDKPSAPAARASAPRRSRAVPIAAALGVLLVLALAWISWPLWGPAMPDGVRAALAPVMDAGRSGESGGEAQALAGRLAGLEREVAGLRSALETVPRVDPQRLSVLEESVRDAAAQLAAMRQRLPEGDPAAAVAALEKRLAELESRLTAAAAEPGSAEAAAALEALRARSAERIARLEQSNLALLQGVADLNRQIAELSERRPAATGMARQNALVLAVGQLREAARGTGPFADALAAVAALAAEDAALRQAVETLRPQAEKGVPDLAELRLRFDRIAGRVAHEAFVPEGDGWVDRTLQRLARVVTIRRADRDAAARDDENGRVARAELRLAAGDLSGAVAALDGLAGTAAEIAAPWLEAARARLAVEKSIDTLHGEALRRAVAGAEGTPGG